jgi:hypothetical protein
MSCRRGPGNRPAVQAPIITHRYHKRVRSPATRALLKGPDQQRVSMVPLLEHMDKTGTAIYIIYQYI